MRALEPMLCEIRSDYRADPDLSRVVLNSTSWFEACLAVGVLSETMPAQTLVALANLREAIKELPRCPLPMRTDFDRLARTWSLEHEGMAWTRRFEHPAGEYSITLLGEGNFVYDIVIGVDGSSIMLMANNAAEDYIHPDAVDLMIERPEILVTVIDLAQAMGLPFYPMFYMSLEDWQCEYATTVFTEVVSGFDRVRHELPASVLPKPKSRTRKRRSRKKASSTAA